MKRFALACAALIASVAIAQAGPFTASLPAHTPIKTVGIISAVGDTFMFEHVRDGAFEWMGPPDATFLEISDWGLDDLVTREVTVGLHRRFAVKPVTFTESDFDTWTYSTLARAIREMPLPEDDIDAYVVILRDWRGDEIGNSVHQVGGLGLYRRDGRVGVFACYRIVIVDAHNYDIIASRAALTPDEKLPWVATDVSLWPTRQNNLGDSQKSVLQTDTRTLIDDTLLPTLERMLPPS